MVAGKVRVAMGFHRSSPSSNRKQQQEMTTPPPVKAPPLPPSGSGGGGREANLGSNQKQVFSRSFGVYFPRSSAQVHAAATRSSPADHGVAELLRQVEELREKEALLQTELLELKLLRESVSIIPILESQISEKIAEIESSRKTMKRLEEENESLRREIEEMKSRSEEQGRKSEMREKEMEGEIAELQKTLSFMESEEHALSASQRFQGLMEASAKSNLMRSLKRIGSFRNLPDLSPSLNPENSIHHRNSSAGDDESGVGGFCGRVEVDSQRKSHSRSNSEELPESSLSTVRSRVPRVPKPPPKRSLSSNGSGDSTENRKEAAVPQKIPPSPPLPPPPPPLPTTVSKPVPPPPPPPPKSLKPAPAKVRRVPEVVEFYHSLMRRDSSNSRRDSTGSNSSSTTETLPATANARDMIGEIENRSAYLLAIKTDVETQGDFIRFLIKEVENAAFSDIDDVVPFVKWLDDELSYLVDERAVLKHFNWPEQKADALREAAFSYSDLKKLESEASRLRDDPRQSSAPALKKMQALLEKLEHGVYNLSRMRESAAAKYKSFQIPVDWMLDSGIANQMKLASVKLAMKYMKRVLSELEVIGGSGGSEDEELIVQGVRFAFRVHQFAGGFDVETMRAFQELRDKARSCHAQCQNQTHHQHKLVFRSTPC